MNRKQFALLIILAIIGAGITYWFSYPIVEWLSHRNSHELFLVIISAVCGSLIIVFLWPEEKHNRRSTDLFVNNDDIFTDEFYNATKDRLDK